MDVAALGFEIDSAPLKAANEQMAKMPAAASGVDRAAKTTEASYKKVQTAAASATRAIEGSSGRIGRNMAQYALPAATAGTWSKTASAIKTVTQEVQQADTVMVKAGQSGVQTALAVAQLTAANENNIGVTKAVSQETAKYTSGLATQAVALQKTNASTGLLAQGLALLKNSYGSLIAVALQLSAATLGVVTLYKFIEASVEAEQIEAQLGATLKATKEAAGQSMEAVKEHANALQDLTTFEDDAVIAASALLLTFTKIKGDVFPKATEVILDVATALKMDLQSATVAVGKALNNPVKGMMTLQRMGVTLDSSQKELIKTYMASGQTMKAQEVILEKLKAQYGGSAKAARDTLGGALTALGHAFGNLFEVSSDSLGPFKEAIENLITAFKDPAFVAFASLIGETLIGALTLAVKGINLVADGVIFLGGHLDTMAVAAGAALVVLAPNILAAIAAGMVAIGTAGVKAVTAITLAMKANPFILLATAIVAITVAIYEFRDDIEQIFGIDVVKVAKDAGNIVIQTFMLIYEDVKFVFSNFGDIVEAAVIGSVNAIGKAFGEVLQTIAKGIDWLSTQVNTVNPFSDIPMIGELSPTKPLPNPAADRLEAAAGKFGAKRGEITATDYIGKIGDAFTKSTPKVKEFSGALGHVNDDLDDLADKAGGGDKNPYEEIIKGAESFIEKQKAEAAAVGMASEESLKLKHTTDLLSKAREAGIKLTETQEAKLRSLGAAMGEAEAYTKGLTQVQEALAGGKEFIQQQNDLRETLGLSAEAAARLKFEQELLSKATKGGAEISDEQRATLAQTAAEMAHTEAQTKSLQESFSFARETTSSFFKEMLKGVMEGKSVWEIFGNTVNKVLDKVLDKMAEFLTDGLFDMFSGKSSSGSGGGLLDMLGGLLNFGGKSSSNNATGSAGGGGLGSLFNNLGGGLSNMWNQTSSFFGGSWSGISNLPAGVSGPAANTAVGGLGGGMFGSGISAMGALGALGGGIGGIMSLMKGGTGNTIGGIGQMIGAGVSLIPGIGQIAGPIIMALSSILPSLLGDGDKREHSYTAGQLNYGPGGFSTGGGAWGTGADATAGQQALGEAGKAIEAVFDLFGGVKDATKVWGMQLNSWTATGKDWSYTSRDTQLVGPGGQVESWRMNEDNMMDTGSAQVVIRSALSGAMGEISEAMKTALTTLSKTDPGLQKVSETISFVTDIYENLGKPALASKAALKELDAQFKAISKTAEELGLAVKPVEDALTEARNKLAKDFMHPINSVLDPMATAFADLNEEMTQMRAEAKHLIDEGFGSIVSMAKLEEFYRRKQQALAEALYGVTIDQLQGAIDSMNVGALSNATIATQYAAAESAFQKTMQDALGGDTKASARLIEEGNNLALLAKAMFGSTSQYENISDQITDAYELMKDLIQQTSSGNTDTTSPPPTGQVSEELQMAYQQINRQTDIIASQNSQINKLLASMTKLSELMQRQVTNK